MRYELRFRQVHMDFHTSEKIPDIGRDFDPDDFARTLEEAHVDSVTCFARGHHGWLYYTSKNMPELMHPNLARRNLLKDQIDACHARGIKVPVYTTVQWDAKTAREHRDWLVQNENGAPFKQKPFDPGFYANICLNTPYVDFLKAHVSDIFESLGAPLDGLFLDILNIQPCCCPNCRAEMLSRGMDPMDVDQRYAFAQEVLDRFKREMTAYIHAIQPDCPVFYNAGFIGTRHRAAIDTFTHLEIESLPGGSWGYAHFPATARYARTLGLDFMGMTGKFHTDWGDFGSYRDPAALEYECFKSLAYGGKCSIGDQLHPFGAIDKATYKLIGGVYAQVEKKEPWCRRAKAVVEAGVLAPQEFMNAGTALVTPGLTGAVNLMTELGMQFNVIDSKEDFSKYRLLVMPDTIPMTEELEERVTAYLNAGGKLICAGRSCLRADGSGFAAFMPVEDVGEAEYCPDYLVAEGPLGEGLETGTEYVMYNRAREVRVREGAKELLKVNRPFFNRTWEHFCSHKQTPSAKEYAYPAAAANENVVYLAHSVFATYDEYACRWIETIVGNAVKLLLGGTLVTHDGPSYLEASLMEQPEENRYVLHLLSYLPSRRSKKLDITREPIDLRGIRIELKGTEHAPLTAKTVPDGAALPIEKTEKGWAFTVPEINGHCMVELGY